ncbi:MAG: hypothetical protein E7092_00170 [Bacteroidales bacterium]|nr:hypothetical protein [Bacteroidales bacterium]
MKRATLYFILIICTTFCFICTANGRNENIEFNQEGCKLENNGVQYFKINENRVVFTGDALYLNATKNDNITINTNDPKIKPILSGNKYYREINTNNKFDIVVLKKYNKLTIYNKKKNNNDTINLITFEAYDDTLHLKEIIETAQIKSDFRKGGSKSRRGAGDDTTDQNDTIIHQNDTITLDLSLGNQYWSFDGRLMLGTDTIENIVLNKDKKDNKIKLPLNTSLRDSQELFITGKLKYGEFELDAKIFSKRLSVKEPIALSFWGKAKEWFVAKPLWVVILLGVAALLLLALIVFIIILATKKCRKKENNDDGNSDNGNKGTSKDNGNKGTSKDNGKAPLNKGKNNVSPKQESGKEKNEAPTSNEDVKSPQIADKLNGISDKLVEIEKKLKESTKFNDIEKRLNDIETKLKDDSKFKNIETRIKSIDEKLDAPKKLKETEAALEKTKKDLESSNKKNTELSSDLSVAKENIRTLEKAQEVFSSRITYVPFAEEYCKKIQKLISVADQISKEANALYSSSSIDDPWHIMKAITKYSVAICGIDIEQFYTEVRMIGSGQVVLNGTMLCQYNKGTDENELKNSTKNYFFSTYLSRYIDALVVFNETLIGMDRLVNGISKSDVAKFVQFRDRINEILSSIEITVNSVKLFEPVGQKLYLQAESGSYGNFESGTIVEVENCVVYLTGSTAPSTKIRVKVQE